MLLSPAPRRQPPSGPRDDDAPPDLPPLDGDDDERESDPTQLTDDEMPKDDGGDPFDDATGEGELATLDDENADADRGSLLDAVDAEGLDIGPPDLVGHESDKLTDDDSRESREDRPHEDYGLGDDASSSMLDAGEEGPETAEESLTGDALPRLDADDEGTPDDAEAFFDDDLSRGAPEAWSSTWERFGAPLSLGSVRALFRSTGNVLAAGRELVRLDLEGGIERLVARGVRGEMTRIVAARGAIFVTTDGGGLFVSRDDGATFVESTGWHRHVRPEEAAVGLDLVASERAGLWGRTAQGALLSSADGAEWEKADVDGFVRAVGVDDAGLPIAFVQGLGVSELLRRTGDGWGRTEVPASLLGTRSTAPAIVVARGKTAAIAVEGDGVVRSLGGGAWSRLAGTEAVTALAILDASGTLVVARGGGEGEPQSSLLHIGAHGEPKTVASWEERADGEAGVTSVAVDEAHQVVWVGGGFGVSAFQPRIEKRP
jgi:hypothetical protein